MAAFPIRINHLARSDPTVARGNTLAAMHTDIRRLAELDRRTYTLETLWRGAVAPRRTAGRRSADRRFPLLDVPEGGVVALALLLVGLSIADAVFTLTLLSRGGTELNPIMAALLEVGVPAFAATKMALTAVPAVLLVATANVRLFGRIRARSVLGALVGLYAGLIVYELLLLSASAA